MVKFLIIRFSSIGDIVLTTPVIRGLKNAVKDSEIHYLVKPAFKSILETNPYIHKIHLLSEIQSETTRELMEEGFDYIIDLQNNFRSLDIKRSLKRMYFTVNKLNFKKWLYVNLKLDRLPDIHIVDRYLKTVEMFDVQSDNNGLDYFIADADHMDIHKLPKYIAQGYIAVVIGAKHETKKMPQDQLIKVIDHIEHPVILIGGPEDRKEGEMITAESKNNKVYNGCGAWNLGQSASIIQQSRCVITHDTGMMHVAAAFNRKIITIWGNTTPKFGMYPYKSDPLSVSFQVERLKCRPCSKLGKHKCPKIHFKCMMDQDIDAIAETANRLFTKA